MKTFALAIVAALLMTETSAIRIVVEDPGDSMEMKVETAIVKEEIKNKMKAKELEDYIKYHYDKVGGGASGDEEGKEEKKAAKKAMEDALAKAKEAADAEKKRRDALTADERKAEDEAAVEKAKKMAMCLASCLRCSNFKVAGASSLVLGAAAVATAFALM